MAHLSRQSNADGPLERGRLDRSTGTYNYIVRYSGEDIESNLSLREKLRINFDLALPDLDDIEGPEQYFNKVTKLVNSQPRWKVRQYVTLSLFNFGKLLMYLDLDPDRWPSGKKITEHSVICQFFTATNPIDDRGGALAEEYKIDSLPNVHTEFPLIEDADSSQHSALVDAIKGKNLVIEGPPGTGKSQTITNLIAAALAQGKKVLFVAEKLAALEVVKRRLDNAGFGDFCLELHSHKSQKRQVLDAIKVRLGKTYLHPSEIQDKITLYESARKLLSEHAERLNSQFKATGLTCHQILMKAVYYRQLSPYPPSEIVITSPILGSNLTPLALRRSEQLIEIFQQSATHIGTQVTEPGNILSHPWAGVTNKRLQPYEIDQVINNLKKWKAALDTLEEEAKQQTDRLNLPSFSSLHELTDFIAEIQSLPPLAGNEPIACLLYLTGNRIEAFAAALKLREQIQAIWSDLPQIFRRECCGDLSALIAAGERLAELNHHLIFDNKSFANLLTLHEQLQATLLDLEKHLPIIQEVSERLRGIFPANLHGLEDFLTVAKHTVRLDPALLQWRNERFDNDGLDTVLKKLHNDIKRLQAASEALALDFQLGQLPPLEELRSVRMQLGQTRLSSWLNGDWRRARRTARMIMHEQRLSSQAMVNRLDDLLLYLEQRRQFENEPGYGQALGEHFRGLNTDLPGLQQLREWYRQIRHQFGAGFGPRARAADAVLRMPADYVTGFRALQQQGVLDQLTSMSENLNLIRQTLTEVANIDASTELAGAGNGWRNLVDRLSVVIATTQPQLRNTWVQLTELQGKYNQSRQLALLIEQWQSSNIINELTQSALQLEIGLDTDAQAAEQAQRLLNFAMAVNQCGEPLQQAFQVNLSHQYIGELHDMAAIVNDLNDNYIRAKQIFSNQVQLNESQWLVGEDSDSFNRICARMMLAATNPNSLANWLDYQRSRGPMAEDGLGWFVAQVECGKLAVNDMITVYHCGIFDRLTREILIESPALSEFAGRSQEQIQQQFRQHDEELIQLQRQRIAYKASDTSRHPVPQGHGGKRVGDYTEMFLLNYQFGLIKRHLPIRQLIERAGNATVALKPCFMMGPMSVAHYLKPGHIEFDLVVMDEASQMKPEDALGAIARGKQLVVVGDPKQLPPTNFFNMLVNGDGDGNDDGVLESSKNILDAAIPVFWPAIRRLRWHYRSQHESLIAFSNQSFYDDDLIIFPSSHGESSEFGVKFFPVAGCFSSRRNMEEAKAIAQEVVKHLLRNTGESIGIVAMNVEQRDQIEFAIETLLKNNPQAQDAYERNQNTIEPLFIKNLENVQGDERDVIYISCTYGPLERDGSVPQRFGPINTADGWRRLNVLFTRAKKRMHIFSSMTKDDIVVKANANQGVQAFRDFLAFAESGHLQQPKLPPEPGPDSPFESSVAKTLKDEGFEIETQVGVAGYFIDIAVRDPARPGRYLIGVECDGATYHSAKSARDRDRLRQAVLENLGWEIHRIWSTDWFKNPAHEIRLLIERLKKLQSEVPIAPVEPEITLPPITVATTQAKTEPGPEEMSLREQLIWFNEHIIRPAFPNTPENKRLLRADMIKALQEYMPETKAEFGERIPANLRQATATWEASQFLQQVLDIITGEFDFGNVQQTTASAQYDLDVFH